MQTLKTTYRKLMERHVWEDLPEGGRRFVESVPVEVEFGIGLDVEKLGKMLAKAFGNKGKTCREADGALVVWVRGVGQ